jgi:hypothetical protein
MNLSAADKIARAVLYEGYMLYPYRPSSVKNQQRWNFGVLYPKAYSEAQGGSDTSWSQTECLLQANSDCRVEIRVRFLHLIERTLGKLQKPLPQWEAGLDPEFEPVDRLEVAGQMLQPWQEAEEREIVLEFGKSELLSGQAHTFTFTGARRLEPVPAESVTSLIIRTTETVSGVIEVSAEYVASYVMKLTVRVRNGTPFEDAKQKDRHQALKRSLLSAHVVLGGTSGEFISLLEPPGRFRDLPSRCQNIGAFPVLVGEAGSRDTVLSSPIILYDYPQIAPESAGDLFDGTEIDEILSLRIMTMTDAEKREMRASDERVRRMLERTEAMSPEQFAKLHGAVRSLQPLKRGDS